MISEEVLKQVEIVQALERENSTLRKEWADAQLAVSKAKDAETLAYNRIVRNEEILNREKNNLYRMMRGG